MPQRNLLNRDRRKRNITTVIETSKEAHINQSAKGFCMCENEQNGEEKDQPSKSRMNPLPLALPYQSKMITPPNV